MGARHEADAAESREDRATAREAIDVLVVEDDPAVRQFLSDLVASLGDRVVACETGPEGLEATRSRRFDVIVLDWYLPGLDGLSVCRQIRAAPGGDLPVVVALTGRDEPGGLEKMLAAGADDYLIKPAGTGQLRARLEIAARRARGRAARRAVDQQLLLLQKAVETTQIGVSVTDLEHRILYANPAEAVMHGYGVEELLGRDARTLAPRSTWGLKPSAERLAGQTALKRESVHLRADGTPFPVQITSAVVSAAGRPIGIVSCCEDITERKRAETALRNSEERYALAARGSNDGLWDWNLETGDIHYSERWKGILGVAEGQLASTPEEWLDRVHPADRDRLQAALDQHLAGQTAHFECSHRLRHSDGRYRWVLSRGLAVRGPSGSPCRIAGSLTDLSERGVHDELTGLPNRALFRDRLRVAAARHRRDPDRFYAVVLIDLDRFKIINEGLGHKLGDQLLVQVTRRLERHVRATDALARADATLARAGGDEFLLLLEDMRHPEDASMIAERLQECLAPAFDLDGHEVHTSSTVGIAVCRDGDDDPDLMRDAAIALHRAKALGKGRIQVFDPAMQEMVNERLKIENELRHALERHELRAVYQPILALDSLALAGCEALVRWQHPAEGLMPPTRFVPVAEESGLIVSLDYWMLEEACRQLVGWERQLGRRLPLSVNVNVSSRHFASGDVVRDVRSALERSGCSGDRLKLEITESTLMENPESAADSLARLRELGVRICVDDFGTGYSSLSYLHRFPLDVIKIDRSFVAAIGEEGKEPAIVRAIISLAHHLGMEVVAEGIETREQLEKLRELGCTHGQGYYFSQPVGHEEALGWFSEPPVWSEPRAV